MSLVTSSENNGFLIVFGSQTGTAEDVANQLSIEARKRDYLATVLSFDELPWQAFVQAKFIVFVCSTTGQGDQPDNMKSFWKLLLRKSLPQDLLAELSYTVFGLGDSSYEKYNFVAKKLFRRLSMLGASPVADLGLGDDQHYLGANGMFDQWVVGFFSKLGSIQHKLRLQLENSKGNTATGTGFFPQHSYLIEPVDENSEVVGKKYSCQQAAFGKVIENTLLTDSGYDKKVVKVTLQLNLELNLELNREISANASYIPGDYISVAPKNSKESVEAFLDLVGLLEQKDLLFSVKKILHGGFRSLTETRNLEPRNDVVKSLFEIVETMLDINSIPKRLFFKYASHFAESELEQEKLEELGSPEGLDLYYSYIVLPKRTVLETISDFPSLHSNIPVSSLLDMFSRIYKKSYSISNYDPTGQQVSLTVGVVKYKTNARMPFRLGTCSNYLCGLNIGDLVEYDLHRGTMTLPPHVPGSTTPIIMVGPGTGIAPFMSFLNYRAQHGAFDNTLFFGCRHENKDFLYKPQLLQSVDTGHLKLFTAFSRDSSQVVYVQDKIREQYRLVANLICKRSAIVYVSGKLGRMPTDVQAAFVDAIAKSDAFGFDHPAAERYVGLMKKTGRYQEECWE